MMTENNLNAQLNQLHITATEEFVLNFNFNMIFYPPPPVSI